MTQPERAHRQFLRFCETGSPEALAEVFDLSAQELLLVAHHLAAPGVAPEDLVQTTFLIAMRSADRFDPERALMPWLCGILANSARSQNRTARRQPELTRLTLETSEDPIAHAYAKEFTAALAEAISELPDRQREVLTLRLIHGLTPTEIAHALREPVGTVKSWVHRGIERLRQRLPAGFAAALLAMIGSVARLADAREVVVAEAASRLPLSPLASAEASLVPQSSLTVHLIAFSIAASAVLLAAVLLLHGGGGDGLRATVFLPESPSLPQVDPAIEGSDRVDDLPRRSEALALVVETRLSVVATFSDGAPASLACSLKPLFGSEPAFRERRFETGVEGTAILRDLEVGRYELLVDRGPSQRIDVERGRSAVRIDLLPGKEIHGTVVDAHGYPISDARVWLSAWGDLSRGAFVTTTDEAGEYTVRGVGIDQGIAFVADGFPVTGVRWVRDVISTASGSTASVSTASGSGASSAALDVTLEGTSQPLAFRVVDEAGEPISGALVQLGPSTDWAHAGMSAMHVVRPPLVLESDRSGRVMFRSSNGSAARVWARATGFSVFVSDTSRAPENIVLIRGACWSGSVMGARSSSVEGIRASDRWCPPEDALPYFASPRSFAADDGRFRVSGLPPGAVSLRAIRNDGGGTHLTREVVLADGVEHEWSPHFEPGQPVIGWALDDSDVPLRGYRVAVFDETDQVLAATVDENGRFEVAGLVGMPGVAWLAAPQGGFPGTLTHRVLPVRAGRDLVLRLPEARKPSATLRVRALDEAGEAVTRLRVSAVADGTLATGRPRDEDWVEFGPLPPGEYHLVAPGDQGTRLIHGPIPLTAGEARVLDELQVRPSGRLRARVAGPEGPVEGRFDATVMTLDGSYMASFFVIEDGLGITGEIPPGIYECRVHDGLGDDPMLVEIRPGVVTDVEFQPRTARVVRIEFSHPQMTVGLVLHRKLIRPDLDRWLYGMHPVGAVENQETGVQLTLRPGSHRIEAWTNEGHCGVAEFEVIDTDAPQTVRVPLLSPSR